ncbi:barstar family protein [Deinococcus gobiensis]|uniref:Barstar superfamily n=1 Tax=Deinococcus gobiensis (strain DSM 21396 / JCM 16679 / CGMCC 1.7299 / I-0) TaxID=745776 RepID=H8H3E9_DEIGI|nr:barstar family protein [Deinococcus gobiensis]AFD28046.1 Barstar superfamily [Deinococcus gobiensis I-0]
MAQVTFDTASVRDWQSFHDVSMRTFGFPNFYGRNMNAWIDCLTYLDEGDGMSSFILGPDELLHIHVPDFAIFAARLPDVSSAFLDCVAFANQRYVEREGTSRLSLVLQ